MLTSEDLIFFELSVDVAYKLVFLLAAPVFTELVVDATLVALSASVLLLLVVDAALLALSASVLSLLVAVSYTHLTLPTICSV